MLQLPTSKLIKIKRRLIKMKRQLGRIQRHFEQKPHNTNCALARVHGRNRRPESGEAIYCARERTCEIQLSPSKGSLGCNSDYGSSWEQCRCRDRQDLRRVRSPKQGHYYHQ